ncbi:MAG: histidinol-phosphate aminotransferase [Candidatus Latescibacterota bacterium]|jgi:histidinol-phosphate aminotransferase
MEDKLRFTDIVSGLPPTVPFVPPEALERRAGSELVLRAGANESNFGASPSARAAMCQAVEKVHWYNDPEGFELRGELARYHRVEREEIALGSGIDELLGLLVRLFVEPGDGVLTSLGAYPTFNYHVEGYGGLLHKVPYRDDCEDLQGLARAAGQMAPKLVYVANPDNPMGTWHSAASIEAFALALPPSSLLILDEAYADFAPRDAIPAVDTARRNIVRLRTFSKAHGMAGARVGYAICHREMVAALDKVRNQFGVNRIAQAGALASLRDESFVQSVVEQVAQGRREYAELASELGAVVLPSATNFIAFDTGHSERAKALVKGLLARGVFVRMPGVAPLDRCIRVTIGPTSERRFFTEILRQEWRKVSP